LLLPHYTTTTYTITAWEGGLVGVQHSNAFESYDSNLSYAAAVSLLLLDAALYTVLAWYLDKVLPAEYGTQLPWWFPVSRGYWNPAAAAPTASATSSEPFSKPSNGSNGSSSNRRNSNSHDRGSRLLRMFSFGKRSTAASAAAVRDDSRSELEEPLLEQQLLPVTAGDSSSSSGRSSSTKVQRAPVKAKIEPVSADLQVQVLEL
jgi:hypothetical protein